MSEALRTASIVVDPSATFEQRLSAAGDLHASLMDELGKSDVPAVRRVSRCAQRAAQSK